MEHKGITVLAVICLITFFSQGSFADISGSITDPSEIGVGARPLGMGKAYVGISDDGNGIFVNPAGLSGIKSLKLTSMSATLLSEIRYVVLGAANPFDYGTLGLGYINVGVGGIPLTTLSGGIPVQYGETNYNAGVFFLSYGTFLDRIPGFGFMKDVSVGGNLKVFLQGFAGGGGATLEGGNGTGMDIDLGSQYKPNKWLTLGMVLQNCLPANLGGRFIWERDHIEESIPMVIKLGGTAKVWGGDGLHKMDDQELNISLDTDMNYTKQRPSVWHLGVEWWPIKFLAIRLGVDQKPVAGESGTGVENNLTGGVGLRYRGFAFDYAYHQYGDLSENVTHFFSIGYVGTDVEEEKKIEEIIKPKPAIVPVVKPKPVVKTFADVPIGYWAKEPIEYLATLGIIGGYPDQTFRPDQSLTRAELASILIKARGMEVAEPTEDPYPDLLKTHWAAKYVKAASDLKFVGGYPDGTFKPSRSLTRAEAIIIITRFAGLSQPSVVLEGPFPDLPATHWAAKAVWAAKEVGLLEYLAGKNFEPNKELTRAEVAEILSKTEFGKAKIKKLLEGEEILQ